MNRQFTDVALVFNIHWNVPALILFFLKINTTLLLTKLSPIWMLTESLVAIFGTTFTWKLWTAFGNRILLIPYWLKHAYHSFACVQPYHLSFTHLEWCNQALCSAINATTLLVLYLMCCWRCQVVHFFEAF